MTPIAQILLALTLTLIIEVPIGVLILKSKRSAIPLTLINFITNPVLNSILIILFSLTQSYAVYWTALAVGEIAVFVSEAVLLDFLCDIPLKRSVRISAFINTTSFLLGTALLSII